MPEETKDSLIAGAMYYNLGDFDPSSEYVKHINDNTNQTYMTLTESKTAKDDVINEIYHIIKKYKTKPSNKTHV